MEKIEAGAPESQSADLMAENIAQLRALFPELVTESADGVAVNVDVLKQLVGDQTLTDVEEKYGLTWHGKRRARQLALTPSTGTLRPCPEESVDWDTTQNLMIEGDNLEVLKLLQKSYSGKVKLIYIDPPYNTGKDFVYPDNFQDSIQNYMEITGQVEGGNKISSNTEASGRFHTDWLNMMYPRLKLAHALLRRDGFLFATIDDAEVHHLRHAMNEIFGEDNFIANVVWQKKYTRANDAQFFSDNHDHILVFAKSKVDSELAGQPRSEGQVASYSNPDEHPKGPWKATPLHAKSGSNTASFRFKNGIEWTPPLGTYRRFSDETMQKMDEENGIWFGTDRSATPSRKSFLAEVKSGVTPVTIWPHNEVGHNHEANNELKALLGQGVFDNPKPTRLIRRMLELAKGSDQDYSITLDFFAGSGTTAHAVMAQNAADGGNRPYILVQLPEPLDLGNKDQKTAADFCDKLGKPRTIAELTKERLRRAGNKIRAEWEAKQSAREGAKTRSAVEQAGQLFSESEPLRDFAASREPSSPPPPDLGFRVFKLDSTNIREWDPAPGDLDAALLEHTEHVKAGRSEIDLLYELLLKLGLDLCVPMETREVSREAAKNAKKKKKNENGGNSFASSRLRVHSIGGGVLLACLAESITRDDVEALGLAIAQWRRELAPAGDTTCVFRDSAFEDDVAKTNMAAILEQHGVARVRSL